MHCISLPVLGLVDVYYGVVPIPFQVYSRGGVDPICSTAWSRVVEELFRSLLKLLCSTTLLHGVEHLYSKILLQNGIERSSGVGVNPSTRLVETIDVHNAI